MYEYLDYSSPLEYFDDVIVKYNVERSTHNRINVVEVHGHEYDPDVASPLTIQSSLTPTSKQSFHYHSENSMSYNTF